MSATRGTSSTRSTTTTTEIHSRLAWGTCPCIIFVQRQFSSLKGDPAPHRQRSRDVSPPHVHGAKPCFMSVMARFKSRDSPLTITLSLLTAIRCQWRALGCRDDVVMQISSHRDLRLRRSLCLLWLTSTRTRCGRWSFILARSNSPRQRTANHFKGSLRGRQASALDSRALTANSYRRSLQS